MDRFIKPVFCMLLALMTANDQSADAQRVFSNSRAAASAHPPRQRTAIGGFSTGRTAGTRWGIPGQPASSDWTLRPPNSNSRSLSTRSIGGRHSQHQHGGIHYSIRSPFFQYAPYNVSQFYGNFGGPIIYGASGFGYNNFGFNPYDQLRIQHAIPLPHSNGFFPNSFMPYGAIATPPIIIPFGGIGNNFSPAPAPLPQLGIQGLQQQQQQQTLPEVDVATETYSKKIATDERPVIDEFHVQPPTAPDDSASTVDRIRSLRYQTSGDSEFRDQDFAAAAALYEASAKTAADRRAPWIRKAWAEIRMQQFAAAAGSLKMAMLLSDDPTNSWIPGEQLYGNQFARDAALQNEALWQWLQERPNSTDRLLLVAGFQQLQGYSGTARELINAALQKGLQQDIVDAFEEIVNDRAGDAAEPTPQRSPSVESPLMIPEQ